MGLFRRKHEWYHGDTRIRSLDDIPAGSLFYRLDCRCGCEKMIDGAALKNMVNDESPRWLLRSLGFEAKVIG